MGKIQESFVKDHEVNEPQTTSKPELTANKVMLCVWWDWKGVVHHEVLPHGLMINSKLYCSQLDRLQKAKD